VALRDVLDEARLDEILGRAAGRTEEEVERLVAALAPRPAPADLVRRLPARAAAASVGALVAVDSAPEMQSPATAAISGSGPEPRANRRDSAEPIAPALHVLRVTVDDEFLADLDAVRAALSHQLPGAGLGELLRHCVRTTRSACERKRTGAGRPGPAVAKPPKGRHIPAAVRTEVWRRDEGACAFRAPDNRRCGSTHQLQWHHRVPFERRGPATVENITVRCRAHNLLAAEHDYGAGHIAAAIAERQQTLL